MIDLQYNEQKESPIEKEKRLFEYSGEDRVISSEEMKLELSRRTTAIVHFDSKLPTLDKYIEGFEGGELIVVSGPTKHGKTTFCQTLTKNFEEQGVKSLWFSFEVPVRQLFEKFAKANEFYLPRQLKDSRLDWLEERIVEAKLKHEIKAVFIDHLHYLVDIEKLKNSSIEIGSIIRKLKLIAIEHNVVIFLMAHTTKTRFEDTPTEGDVRDSSFIPQEADSTLMLWRERKKSKKRNEAEYSGRTILIVSNHRRTGVMAKMITLGFVNGILLEAELSNFDIEEAQKEI